MVLIDKLSLCFSFIILGLGIACTFFPIPSLRELILISGFNMLGVLGFILAGIFYIIGTAMNSRNRIIASFILGIASWALLIILNIISVFNIFKYTQNVPSYSSSYYLTVYNRGLINGLITICFSGTALIFGIIILRRSVFFLKF